MKVTVDQDKCVSSGQCVLNAAEVFDQRDEDGVVVLLNTNPPADQADNVAPRRRGLSRASHPRRGVKHVRHVDV